MRFAFSLIILVLFGSGGIPDAAAGTKEIVSEGTYTMGDGETPSVAESRALQQAKKSAMEQAGVYIESYSRVNKITIEEDEVHVIASGLMELEVLDKKRTIIGDGINFWVKIRARVNPDKIVEMARSVKERTVIADYKRIQEAYARSQSDIHDLKRQLSAVRGEQERRRVEAKIISAEKWFQANEWLDKGKHHWLNKEYDEAIVSVAVSLLLNPSNADAYMLRGVAHLDMGQQDKAIEDFSKAIDLDPSKPIPYYNRGCSYHMNGQYDKAIEDYNKAIVLKPGDTDAYINRGRAYSASGDAMHAVSDFRRACELGSTEACTNLTTALQSNVL